MRTEKLEMMQLRELTLLGRPGRFWVGGHGPQTLLLLHGAWGGAAGHWSRVWNYFAQHTRVVAPELPGLGDLKAAGYPQLSTYVAWLNALLNRLEIPSVYCIGNSFGASLAWSFAGRSPERCLGLVMVNGMPMRSTPGPLAWFGRRVLGRRWLKQTLMKKTFNLSALPKAFADQQRVPPEIKAVLSAPTDQRIDTFIDCMINGDAAPPPQSPLLVIWGRDDHLPGTSVRKATSLAKSLPGGRLVSIANAGHFPQLEHPLQFADRIDAFVKQTLLAPLRRATRTEPRVSGPLKPVTE